MAYIDTAPWSSIPCALQNMRPTAVGTEEVLPLDNTGTIHIYISQATTQIKASTDETSFAVAIENVVSASQMWIIIGRLKQKTHIMSHTHIGSIVRQAVIISQAGYR